MKTKAAIITKNVYFQCSNHQINNKSTKTIQDMLKITPNPSKKRRESNHRKKSIVNIDILFPLPKLKREHLNLADNSLSTLKNKA
jgi:hypothetical protein